MIKLDIQPLHKYVSNFIDDVNHFRVSHQNVQCIKNKVPRLEIELELQQIIYIPCFTEHWMKES